MLITDNKSDIFTNAVINKNIIRKKKQYGNDNYKR